MDKVTCAKNKFRMNKWAELIRQCQASGMKVNDWCAANCYPRRLIVLAPKASQSSHGTDRLNRPILY